MKEPPLLPRGRTAQLEAIIARQQRVDGLLEASQSGCENPDTVAHVTRMLDEEIARMGNPRVTDLERRGYVAPASAPTGRN